MCLYTEFTQHHINVKKKFCGEQKPYYWINISQNISGIKYGFGNLHPDHATVYYKYLPCDIVTISNSKMQNCLKIFFKRYTTYLSSILENLEKISCRPKSFWCQTIVFFSKPAVCWFMSGKDSPNIPRSAERSAECSVIFGQFLVLLFNGGTGKVKRNLYF